MSPKLENLNVVAICPDCGGVPTTFEHKKGSSEYGSIAVLHQHKFKGANLQGVVYRLLRCAVCGRGGLAKYGVDAHNNALYLEEFLPASIERAKIPDGIPEGIVEEYREAELCASVGARRAASALLRSTLEKTLRASGYIKRGENLKDRIDKAAADGIITESRKKRAHGDVRVLGNDIMHDEWREVTPEEVTNAHHYVQRILEDFYDDRDSVEAILREKGRLTEEVESSDDTDSGDDSPQIKT